MGVLAPGSAHARPSARPPIDTSGNFQRTCLQSNLQKFQRLSQSSETSDMTSEGLGEMFEGDSEDTCPENFRL